MIYKREIARLPENFGGDVFHQWTDCPFEPEELPAHYPPPPMPPAWFDGVELYVAIRSETGLRVSTLLYHSAAGEWHFVRKWREPQGMFSGVFLFPAPGQPDDYRINPGASCGIYGDTV